MFRRAGGNFYARDKVTRKTGKLGTMDKAKAKQLLAAKNQSVAQPQLNRTSGSGLFVGQIAGPVNPDY